MGWKPPPRSAPPPPPISAKVQVGVEINFFLFLVAQLGIVLSTDLIRQMQANQPLNPSTLSRSLPQTTSNNHPES